MTDLLAPSDRPVTDRGEPVETQPKVPRRSRLAWLLIAWPYIVPLVMLSVVYGRTVQRSTGNHFEMGQNMSLSPGDKEFIHRLCPYDDDSDLATP